MAALGVTVKAGLLRHRIRLDAPTDGVDSLGAPTKTWTPVTEVQAQVGSVSGKEYFGANRDLGEELYKIIVRRVPGVHIDPTYRATDVDSGAVYSITAVLDSHDRDMLTLIARAGAGHP